VGGGEEREVVEGMRDRDREIERYRRVILVN